MDYDPMAATITAFMVCMQFSARPYTATSNEVRVRVDGFSKIRAKFFPPSVSADNLHIWLLYILQPDLVKI